MFNLTYNIYCIGKIWLGSTSLRIVFRNIRPKKERKILEMSYKKKCINIGFILNFKKGVRQKYIRELKINYK